MSTDPYSPEAIEANIVNGDETLRRTAEPYVDAVGRTSTGKGIRKAAGQRHSVDMGHRSDAQPETTSPDERKLNKLREQIARTWNNERAVHGCW